MPYEIADIVIGFSTDLWYWVAYVASVAWKEDGSFM
jgi:hypothetical protein